MKKQRSTNNKGFSLVELIVVIAIMAVLVGIIAPQFVKYVQQARKSSDTQNIDLLQNTANSVLADPGLKNLDDTNTAGGAEFVITSGKVATGGNSVDLTGAAAGNFQTLLEIALGNNSDGDPKYPTPIDSTKTKFVITVTGTKDIGYSAAVKME